jgi:hypothetical protein
VVVVVVVVVIVNLAGGVVDEAPRHVGRKKVSPFRDPGAPAPPSSYKFSRPKNSFLFS